MKPDKVFILLLVILLPITGCLDMTDNAEAEGSDEETTIVNNYYNNTTEVYHNNTTEVSMLPAVYSLHIERGTVATFDFDGNETWKLESLSIIYQEGESGNNGYALSFNGYSVNCSGTLLFDSGRLYVGQYLPVLAGESCSVELPSYFAEYVLTFSKANLASL